VAWALDRMCHMARLQGEYAEAAVFGRESLALFREMGNRGATAGAQSGLGSVMLALGEAGQAAAFFQEALRLHRETDRAGGVAACLEGLAGVATRTGRARAAARLFGAPEALREAAGLSEREPADQGDYDRNLALLHTALEPAALDAEWAAGRALSLDAALALATEVAASV
jgi:hypothetical protein